MSPCILLQSHRHLPPWIRLSDLFRHQRITIVSWGVHDLFFLEVCSWGCALGVWCCPFFQGGWSSFVCIPEISSSFLMTSLLILSSLVYPVTLLRKCISAASRQVMSLFMVTHVSLPYSSDGLTTKFIKFHLGICTVFFKCSLIVPHIPWNLFIFLSKSGSPSKLSSHPK